MQEPDARLIEIVKLGIREELKYKIATEHINNGKDKINSMAEADNYLSTDTGIDTIYFETEIILQHYNLHFDLSARLKNIETNIIETGLKKWFKKVMEHIVASLLTIVILGLISQGTNFYKEIHENLQQYFLTNK